jgi:hypothetical protein
LTVNVSIVESVVTGPLIAKLPRKILEVAVGKDVVVAMEKEMPAVAEATVVTAEARMKQSGRPNRASPRRRLSMVKRNIGVVPAVSGGTTTLNNIGQ